ncbi:hypothetical protein PM082_014490 [Marasmius tenuissimus]|nr:hypothetical protein PM082_014490 [Marasmius tenuissimus]
MHTAHGPLLDGMDSSCGLFDLSVYSSIVSLAAYLFRIIPPLSAPIDKAREDKSSFSEDLAVWRLDALPPQCEEHEESRTEVWVARIQNDLSIQNTPISVQMSSQPSERQTRSTTKSLAPPSAPSSSAADTPQRSQMPVVFDNKPGARGASRSKATKSQRSGGSRSATSQGSKLAPVVEEEVLNKIDEEYLTPEEKDLAKKVYASMAKTYRAASELAAIDEPEKGCLATSIFMDRIVVSLGWCPAWLQPRYSKSMYAHIILDSVAANYVNVCLNPAKRLDPVSFTHLFLEGNGIGQDRKDAHPLAKRQNPTDVYNNLLDEFDVLARFRPYSDPGSDRMQVLTGDEHKILLSSLSTIVHYSELASDVARDCTNASEAECRFAWDGMIEIAMASASKNLVVKREMRIALARNTHADLVCDQGHFEVDPKAKTAPSGTTKAFSKVGDVKILPEFESGLLELWTALGNPPDNPETPDTQTDSDGIIKDSATTFRTEQLKALKGHVRERQKELTKKHEVFETKNSPIEVVGRALSVWYHYAICDASVSVALPVPDSLYATLETLGGVLVDGMGAPPEPDTPRTKPREPISISTPSLQQAIKELVTELKNSDRPQKEPLQPSASHSPPRDEMRTPERDLAQELANKFASILLPFLFLEYKKGLGNPDAGVIQAEFYVASAIRFLATMGIFEMPVFAISTVGAIGRLICGWGRSVGEVDSVEPFKARKKPLNIKHSENVVIMMGNTNCPQWNIADATDAIRFAIFLIRLRTQYYERLVTEFKRVFDDLLRDVKAASDGDEKAKDRFRWRLFDQLVEDPFWKYANVFLPASRRKEELTKTRKKREEEKGEKVPIDLSSVDDELKEAKKLW